MKGFFKKGESDQCVAKGRCELMSFERLKLVRQLQWFSPATFRSSGTGNRAGGQPRVALLDHMGRRPRERRGSEGHSQATD